MKRIVCTIALIGLAGALQAVTYSWNAASKAFEDGDGNKLGAYASITSLAFAIQSQGTRDDVAHAFFAIQQRGTDGTTTDLVGLSVEQVSGTSTYRSVYTINGKTYTSKLTNFWGGEPDKDQFYTWFDFSGAQDGVFTSATATTSNGGGMYDDTFTGETFDFRGKSFDLVTMFDETNLISAQITIEGTPLPEPGVVALLALGVGALALRRRA